MNPVQSRRQPPADEAPEQRYCDADALEYCPKCETSHPVSRVDGDYEGECPQQ